MSLLKITNWQHKCKIAYYSGICLNTGIDYKLQQNTTGNKQHQQKQK